MSMIDAFEIVALHLAQIFSRQRQNLLLLALTILMASVVQADGQTSADVLSDSSNAHVHDLVAEIVSHADGRPYGPALKNV